MNDRVQNSIFRQPRAIDLLQQYRPGVTFFGTPRATLLTYGVKAAVPLCAVQNLAAAATALLGEAEREGDLWPILIGAIPFGADAPARLFIPQQVLIGLGVKEQRGAIQPAPKPDSKPAPGAVQMRPTPDQYRHNVSRALSKIDAAAIEKVVLSRSLSLQGQVDLPALLQGLVGRNPLAYSFAIDLVDALPDAPAERRTLIGASPELLLARYGREVVSHPLAGSIPRSADAQEDRRRADALLCSHKDLREHALVVDAVAATLRPYCSTLSVPSAPTLLATPTMWHLGTEVRGELADPSVTSLQLALALHPTPAVCGHPTTAAKEFIAETEGFDRGFFAGLVGWCDMQGDGEWAVTLRCAEVGEHSATLYAGAGIVAGSEPELELLETAAKLRTMLSAMGLESVLEQTP